MDKTGTNPEDHWGTSSGGAEHAPEQLVPRLGDVAGVVAVRLVAGQREGPLAGPVAEAGADGLAVGGHETDPALVRQQRVAAQAGCSCQEEAEARPGAHGGRGVREAVTQVAPHSPASSAGSVFSACAMPLTRRQGCHALSARHHAVPEGCDSGDTTPTWLTLAHSGDSMHRRIR